MRVTAIVLLAALLLNAAVAMPARAMRSCCCAKRAASSCPLKRTTAKTCEPGKGMSCSMRSGEPATTFTQRAAILATAVSIDVHLHFVTYARPRFDVVTRAMQPPEPPPPKLA